MHPWHSAPINISSPFCECLFAQYQSVFCTVRSTNDENVTDNCCRTRKVLSWQCKRWWKPPWLLETREYAPVPVAARPPNFRPPPSDRTPAPPLPLLEQPLLLLSGAPIFSLPERRRELPEEGKGAEEG